MNYYTDKHGLIENIGNWGNEFRNTVETNLKSYFNELINFSKLFAIFQWTNQICRTISKYNFKRYNWILFTRS